MIGKNQVMKVMTILNSKPFEFGRPDICPYCNSNRALEVYNRFDKPMNYSFILDRKQNPSEKLIDIEYIKCKKCYKKFFPRWEGDILYPNEEMNEHDFMAYYKANKDK